MRRSEAAGRTERARRPSSLPPPTPRRTAAPPPPQRRRRRPSSLPPSHGRIDRQSAPRARVCNIAHTANQQPARCTYRHLAAGSASAAAVLCFGRKESSQLCGNPPPPRNALPCPRPEAAPGRPPERKSSPKRPEVTLSRLGVVPRGQFSESADTCWPVDVFGGTAVI